jgi:VanZ family protein
MTSPVPATHGRLVDVLLWALTFASAGLTLWLSLGPVPPGASAFPASDKVFHAVAYFVTTLLLLFAAVWRPGRGPGPLARFASFVLLAVIASGLVVEFLQVALTARRGAELGDWIADMAGVLGAALVHWLVRRFTATRSHTPTMSAPDLES